MTESQTELHGDAAPGKAESAASDNMRMARALAQFKIAQADTGSIITPDLDPPTARIIYGRAGELSDTIIEVKPGPDATQITYDNHPVATLPAKDYPGPVSLQGPIELPSGESDGIIQMRAPAYVMVYATNDKGERNALIMDVTHPENIKTTSAFKLSTGFDPCDSSAISITREGTLLVKTGISGTVSFHTGEKDYTKQSLADTPVKAALNIPRASQGPAKGRG